MLKLVSILNDPFLRPIASVAEIASLQQATRDSSGYIRVDNSLNHDR